MQRLSIMTTTTHTTEGTTMTKKTMIADSMISINRADDGSGGWSIHDERPGHEGDDLLVTGRGRMVHGQWAQPSRRAYSIARRVMRERDGGRRTSGVDIG
jgi:hypothetical protein